METGYYDALDDYYLELDKIVNEASRHNKRLLKAVKRVLGARFSKAVTLTADDCEACPSYKWKLVKKPRGDRQSHDIKPIKWIWVDQWAVGCDGDSWEGHIYIPLKENLYLEFYYTC